MKNKDYLKFIKKCIKNHALLSSVLEEKLVKKFNIRPDYARKIVSKFIKEKSIYSSENLLFDNGARGCSLSASKNEYLCLLNEYKNYLFQIFEFMDSNDGIISKQDICKISGCLLKPTSKYLCFDKALREMRYFFKIHEKIYNEQVFFVKDQYLEYFDNNIDKIIKVKQTEKVFQYSFIKLLMSMNIIAKSFFYTNKNKPFYIINKHGIVFDVFSDNSIRGITEDFSQNNNTIVVLDFNLLTEYTEDNLNNFYRRVQKLTYSIKETRRNVLPIVCIKNATPVVIDKIKKHNMLLYDFSNIMGKEFEQIFNSYCKIVDSNNTEEQTQEIESVLKNIENKSDGIWGNIRGDLFDRTCILMINDIIGCDKIIDKRDSFNIEVGDKKAEIDYMVKTNKEIILFEFKAKKSKAVLGEFDIDKQKYDNDSLNKFFKYVLPLYKESKQVLICKGCFISANGFYGEDALKELNKLDNDENICPINFLTHYDAKEFMKKSRETNNTLSVKNREILKKYYIDYFNNN